MNTEEKKLKDFGGTLKKLKNGNSVAAFSSCAIFHETIEFLSGKDDIDNLLFHFCDFKDVDFSILKESNVKLMSVMHGNFSNVHLQQLEPCNSLDSIKLHDTKVTEEDIESFMLRRPTMKFL